MKAVQTKLVSTAGNEYALNKFAAAHINPQNCVNCGKCRDICPVEAISEQQRIVCHLCPSCTSQPAITFDEMVELATEKKRMPSRLYGTSAPFRQCVAVSATIPASRHANVVF